MQMQMSQRKQSDVSSGGHQTGSSVWAAAGSSAAQLQGKGLHLGPGGCVSFLPPRTETRPSQETEWSEVPVKDALKALAVPAHLAVGPKAG